jgi:hypothetical protein
LDWIFWLLWMHLFPGDCFLQILDWVGHLKELLNEEAWMFCINQCKSNFLNNPMWFVFFSCLVHNSVGWWFGFRDFEAYNMELPVLFKSSYLRTQQHEEVMGTVSFRVIEFGWGWENFNWVLLSVSSILALKSSANLLIFGNGSQHKCWLITSGSSLLKI